MEVIKISIEVVLGFILFAFFIYLMVRLGTLGALHSIDQVKREKLLKEKIRVHNVDTQKECN